MSRAALAAGAVVLALVWLGPLLSTWRESFSAHMLAHMAVVAIAAPLLAVGLSGSRVDPESHGLRLSPLLTSVLDLVVVWFWHAPTLRRIVIENPLAGALEQASFLVAGLLLWLSCLGAGRDGKVAGAAGLLFTSIHMTLLGALLTLAPRPLYGEGEVTCFGLTLSVGRDQELGGVMMLTIGAAVYLVGGLALLGRILNEDGARGRAGR